MTPDPKTRCTCNHPAAEHAGDGFDGHCKVPSCRCPAFTLAEAIESSGSDAKHTILARATDEAGIKGVEIRAVGSGSMEEMCERVATRDRAVLVRLSEMVKDQYRLKFGEEPEHAGVAIVPYLDDEDDGDD